MTNDDWQQLKIWVVGFLLLHVIGVSGQFRDDFSDTDLMDDVTWVGDVANFAVISERLQLQASEAGASNLSTVYNFGDSLRFGLDVQMQFAPSADNQLTLYLYHAMEDPALGEALYMILGESGGDDAFVLFQRDALGTETELQRFASIPHTSSLLNVRVEVEYIELDGWSFSFDYDGDGSFDDTQSVGLSLAANPGYFGLTCRYTSTRTDRFVFDNAFVEKIIPDRTPPILLQVEAVSVNKLNLLFDEEIDAALVASQFNLIPGNIQPALVEHAASQPNQVCLTFADDFVNLTSYSIEADNISDVNGNEAELQTGSFTVLFPADPEPSDIIINEIHFAPSTTTVLPNAEFVELFNRSDKILNLSDLQFRDASTSKVLPDYIIMPGEYIVLVDRDDENLFEFLDTVALVDDLPSLNNEDDNIGLLSLTDIIDQVNYQRFWLQDESKQSGWSLERKNPDSECSGLLNWIASDDPTGGTPGEINSVFTGEEPEGQAVVDEVRVFSSRQVILHFDIEMNADQLLDQSNFQISPAVTVSNLELNTVDGQDLLSIALAEDLIPSQLYTITFNTSICFCNGRKWDEPYAVEFGLPEQPEEGDIRISEILFSPFSGESEFIELTNTSDKIIRSSELWLHYLNTSGNFAQSNITVDFLLLPGEYHVLSSEPSSILNTYTVPFPEHLHQFNLPSLTNAGGLLTVFLFDNNLDSIFIDDAIYSPNFHDPLLDEENGVSLERLGLMNDGRERSSWYSASTLDGGATPTGENSQRIISLPTGSDNFELVSPTFSPDSDGFEDAMVLTYDLDAPGFVAQVDVYSYDGVLIKSLVNNESLGLSGQILWSGDTNEGAAARIGIYYVLIKAFQVGGETIEEKKKIVLARML